VALLLAAVLVLVKLLHQGPEALAVAVAAAQETVLQE
jgi:hypothetical protein